MNFTFYVKFPILILYSQLYILLNLQKGNH